MENGRETVSITYRALDIVKDENTRVLDIVAATFDAGSLSKFLSHLTGGFMLVDPRWKNPLTGE